MPTSKAARKPIRKTAERPDFRTLSAQRKRERMRARLLAATVKVCAERGAQAVIEDILEKADVSRGTFYAHFKSLHDAISWAGQAMADEQVDALLVIFADLDSVRRVAAGSQSILARAAVDPAWGSVIARIDDFSWSSSFLRAIREDTVNGQRDGVFRASDSQAMIDLNVGALIRGARTLQDRKTQRWRYIQDQAVNLLVGMGVKEAEAKKSAAWAKAHLRSHGIGLFPWWRDFD